MNLIIHIKELSPTTHKNFLFISFQYNRKIIKKKNGRIQIQLL